MDLLFIAVLFILGFIGSYFSGMLGVGGAIINYPLLLFMPPLLGFKSFTSYEVTGIVAFQVLFATLSGVLGYWKTEYLSHKLIIYMGVSILFGSLLGSVGSSMVSEDTVNIIYGTLATVSIIMMLIPTSKSETKVTGKLRIDKGIASLLAFIIGIGSGIVGAGGAFLLIPIMLVVLKLPTRVTIASSMAITFISAIGTSTGKLVTGQVPFIPTLIVVIASLIAAQLGVATGKKMNTKTLKVVLSLFIFGTAVKVWMDLIF